MDWICVFVAACLETLWPFALKRFSNSPWAPAIIAILASVPIFYLLSFAMKTLPPSTVYVSFVCIASIALIIGGMLFLGESISTGRLISLVMAITGAVGLKYFSA
jgi:multidrug transporter EmrE-like cation transporter